jgi:ribosomal protein S18 acetylase RimI-like enzyme
MKYSLYPIHQIDPALITPMAKLHESALKILLSEMGFPFVLRYFQLAVEDPSVIGFYAMSEANTLIGYVVGAPRPDELNSKLTRPRLWFLGQCLRLLFTRPKVLWQAVVSSLTLSKQVASETDAIEVVYMSVDPQARGQGLGRALMQAFHDASREAGYKRVFGSQEVDNNTSIGLLTSMGYKVKYTFREGHYDRQRIELIL